METPQAMSWALPRKCKGHVCFTVIYETAAPMTTWVHETEAKPPQMENAAAVCDISIVASNNPFRETTEVRAKFKQYFVNLTAAGQCSGNMQ